MRLHSPCGQMRLSGLGGKRAAASPVSLLTTGPAAFTDPNSEPLYFAQVRLVSPYNLATCSFLARVGLRHPYSLCGCSVGELDHPKAWLKSRHARSHGLHFSQTTDKIGYHSQTSIPLASRLGKGLVSRVCPQCFPRSQRGGSSGGRTHSFGPGGRIPTRASLRSALKMTACAPSPWAAADSTARSLLRETIRLELTGPRFPGPLAAGRDVEGCIRLATPSQLPR